MGSLTWKSSLPGNWSAATNWTVLSGPDTVPGYFDDVTINAPLNYVVTLDGSQYVNNLTLNGTGARLAVTGTLTLGGTLLAQSGSLAISGDLLDGTVDLAGAAYSLNGSLLVHTTWVGPVSLYGTVSVFDGFNALADDGVSPGDVSVGMLNVLDTNGTLDNVTLRLGDGSLLQEMQGTTLTLGPNLTALAEGGASFVGYGGTAVNLGTMELAASGAAFRLAPNFINDGILTTGQSLGAYITADGDLTNNAVLDLANFNTSIVYGDLYNTGTIIAGSGPAPNYVGTSAGIYWLHGNLTGGLVDVNNGWVDVAGTIGAGTQIVRQGPMSIRAGAIAPGVTIDGFYAGDDIRFKHIAQDGNINVFWSGTPAGGTLSVMDGATLAASVYLTGIADGSTFIITNNGTGTDTDITTTNPAPCFTSGTRIATPCGPVPVEHLRPGDHVLSAFGGHVPIIWIGHRQLDCRRHLAPATVWPIRIQAGALGDGTPTRDLRVSPEHALYIDGLLIPAGLLVNGTTITREPRAHVTYWHLELPQHDVIFAEGAPAESYLDTGNRADFDNGPVVTAHPDFSPARANDIWLAQAGAPQCRDGARLEAVRARLLGVAVAA